MTPEHTDETSPGSGDVGFLFRADDRYRGGPVGLALGEEADSAAIQDFAEHVLRKESSRFSRYTSFSTEIRVARRFTAADDLRNLRKVEMAALRELETSGHIKIWDRDTVREALSGGPKKVARQAGDVWSAMGRNCEILVEGQIPADLLRPVR